MKLLTLSVLLGALLLFQQSNATGIELQHPNNCYLLHLKAKPVQQALDFGGHHLTLRLGKETRIQLQNGPVAMIDADGTDGKAVLSLPNPDSRNSGTSGYSMFVRLVGKPGTFLKMRSCYYYAGSGFHCSQNSLELTRIPGHSEFENATKDLLYIYPGNFRVPLFSNDGMQDFFWFIENSEKLNAQIRICPVSTTVP